MARRKASSNTKSAPVLSKHSESGAGTNTVNSKLVVPPGHYNVVIQDFRQAPSSSKDYVKAIWDLEIVDGDHAGTVVQKYNNVTSDDAFDFLLYELYMLCVDVKSKDDLKSASTELIGKRCRIHYGENVEGYPQASLDFEPMNEECVDQLLDDMWKRHVERYKKAE